MLVDITEQEAAWIMQRAALDGKPRPPIAALFHKLMTAVDKTPRECDLLTAYEKNGDPETLLKAVLFVLYRQETEVEKCS